MCDAGLNPVLMNCPDGLFWDTNLNVCNWPENVECEQSGESSSSESSSSSSSSSSEEWRFADDKGFEKAVNIKLSIGLDLPTLIYPVFF